MAASVEPLEPALHHPELLFTKLLDKRKLTRLGAFMESLHDIHVEITGRIQLQQPKICPQDEVQDILGG